MHMLSVVDIAAKVLSANTLLDEDAMCAGFHKLKGMKGAVSERRYGNEASGSKMSVKSVTVFERVWYGTQGRAVVICCIVKERGCEEDEEAGGLADEATFYHTAESGIRASILHQQVPGSRNLPRASIILPRSMRGLELADNRARQVP